MEDEKAKFYVFIWKIENYSFTFQREDEFIESPKFEVFSLGLSPFCLKLYPRGTSKFKNFTSLYLELTSPREDQNISVGYELSILNTDGNPEYLVKENSCPFLKGQMYGFSDLVTPEEILHSKKSILLPEDTLTLRCRIRYPGPQTIQAFAKTIIYLHRQMFIRPISNISQTNEFSSTFSIENADLCFKLELDAIHIQLEVPKNVDRVFHLKIGILSKYMRESYLIDEYLLNWEKQSVAFFITKQDLLQWKDYYLPDGCLKLSCAITYSRRVGCAYFQGITYDEILT